MRMLIAVLMAYHVVSLAWELPRANPAQGFVIERSNQATQGWVAIGWVPGTVYGYEDKLAAVKSAEPIYYRVIAYNRKGTSVSNVAEADIP